MIVDNYNFCVHSMLLKCCSRQNLVFITIYAYFKLAVFGD